MYCMQCEVLALAFLYIIFQVPMIAVRSCYLVVHLFLNAASGFPISLNFLIACIFYHQFNFLDKRFDSWVTEETARKFSSDEGGFETLRLHHQKLCKMVERADGFINLCNAASILGHTATVILVLYGLVWSDPVLNEDHMGVISSVFWISVSSSGLFITSSGGILVNQAVSFSSKCEL